MTLQSPALLELTTKPAGFEAVSFLVYYHAARNGQLDRISQYVQDFRDGMEPQTSRWVSLGGELAGDAGSYDIVIRALGSNETAVKRGSSLDHLCEAIAQRSGSRYQPARLTKVRTTRRLQGLGGHAAHQKELSGAYKFDGMGLRADAHILVVDDLLATGATLEAIASAVYASLPGASVAGFVLGKTGSPMSLNTIDPDYFVSRTAVRVPGARVTTSTKGSSPATKSTPKSSRPAPSKKALPAQPRSPSRHRRTTSVITVLGVLLALAIIGAMVPFRPAPKARPAEISNEEWAAVIKGMDTLGTRVQEPPPAPPVVAEQKNLRPGIVMIPSAGLRTNHSLDAKCLRKVVIRLGEKIEILQKYSAQSGPDWMQVRTRSGNVGWVMASTIAEARR